MKPKKIRDELRSGTSEDLERRRKLILLSTIGIADFGLIALLQSGVIRRLPDIPYPVFDTNGINTSKTSYAMGVPDAFVSNLMFSMKMALATAGGSEKTSRKPVFDLLLGAVSLGHSLGAVKMTYDMLFKKKKICVYCLTGAGLIFSAAAIIAPTAMNGARKVFGLARK
jgi:uncharacterized membrane protein